MPWILLAVAILLEVAGITAMKLSRGFAELLPSIAVPVFYCAVGRGGDPGAAGGSICRSTYAIWSGVGTALAVTIGIAYFREPLTAIKLASLALVILGVVEPCLSGRASD